MKQNGHTTSLHASMMIFLLIFSSFFVCTDAQELIKIIPEAVEQGKGVETFTDENGNTLNVDGMHTVNMDAVVMDLIGSVQALQKQVAMLIEMLNTSNCTRIPKVPRKKTNDFKPFKPFVLGLKKT